MLLKTNIPRFNICYHYKNKLISLKSAIGGGPIHIVELAKDFGLELQYAKKFFYTPKEKESGLLIINRNLENDQPVLVSIHGTQNSHMFVVHGLKESDGEIIGYYIQDPDGRVNGHNYFLTKQEFLSSWRGGLIY